MNKKILTSFKLWQQDKRNIELLAKKLGLNNTQIIERALHRYVQDIENGRLA